jgi:hypothetical protein
MSRKSTLNNRRPQVTVEGKFFAASVGFDPATGAPCELFFVSRGKSGTDISDELDDLSREISLIMQHRPEARRKPKAEPAPAPKPNRREE